MWRSTSFWHSDIEDIMDYIVNESMGYHPDSREEFIHDVMTAINDHLENNFVKRERLMDKKRKMDWGAL